ncbi:MAG: TOBE-like domain-containing protein, partial [Proteobacteria bacterium]|nr:TOBE-like domain-containing protein [Pseudomonadota bacterium]
SLFVTHDQEEALEVADRMVLMNHGKIEQIGTPGEVYDQPASPFVYGFLGSVNLFHGRVQGDHLQVDEHLLALDQHTLSGDTQAIAYARPHEVDVVRPSPGATGIPVIIKRILSFGAAVRLELERTGAEGTENAGTPIEAEIGRDRLRELALVEGDHVLIQPRGAKVFPANPAAAGADQAAT